MANEKKEARAVRKKAVRLAKSIVSVSSRFREVAELAPGPERDALFSAIRTFATAAIPWMSGRMKSRVKRRRSPGTAAGWLGGW